MFSVEALARIFSELVVLMELKGDNPFKIRAYQNAARVLQTSSMPLTELLKSPPKGFGKGLLEKVAEFMATGELHEHQELMELTPKGLFDLLRIKGLGPRKVKLLYETLGVTSMDELEKVVNENKLTELPGFGAKMQRKIIEGIAFLRQFSGKFRLFEAALIADDFLAPFNREFPGVDFHLAGSLRRRKEVVKDIDILVASDSPRELMEFFVHHPHSESVVSAGEAKSSILTKDGIQVDLRVVPPESLGSALCYFTGSKEHNTKLRSIALKQGKKLNEYGLYEENGTAFPLLSETEVYQNLGMDYIPPELREDMGEIEWAIERKIPELVEVKDLQGVMHVHTVMSDGYATLEQLVEEAQKLGYSWLGICDHSKSAYYAGGLTVEAVHEQWGSIDRLNRKQNQVVVLKGIECDILADGSLDYSDEVLEGFDFVVASIHTNFTLSIDEMTARLVRAIEHPMVDIIGHISGRILLDRNGYDFHWDKVLDACVKNRVIIEINANPYRLDVDWGHIRSGGNPDQLFAIGVDAHDLVGLGDAGFGVGVARKGALTLNRVINCLPFKEFLKLIESRRRR